MSAFFDELERDLVVAALRRRDATARRPRRRGRWHGLLLATALCLGVGAATAGGTLYVIRGSVIPAPAARDVPRDQLPVAGSARLAAVRAADPAAGRPAWTIRVARSQTGLLCSTIGELVGGRFGLTGLDGRFRLLPERIVDGCGAQRADGASLVGVRVFDARRRPDVRSLVYAVAGERLRAAVLTTGSRTTRLPIAAGGVVLAALRGYPEDIGVGLVLRFADGRVERHPFGTSRTVVPDPGASGAWRAQRWGVGSKPGEPPDTRGCVYFSPAREVHNPPFSPSVCGDIGDGTRHPQGWFFAARRLRPGHGGLPALDGDGHWGRHPPRTAVWGAVGDDVRRVELLGPGTSTRELALTPSRAFLAVFADTVNPADLQVRVTFRDGRTETARHSAHLVKGPFR